MSGWQNVLTASSLLFFISSAAFADQHASIELFKKSWTAEALKLQREIDMNAPLNMATFIGTHNSYNSKSYEIPPIRYIDPNQILSIYDQLEMGARSIEFDAHWTKTNISTNDILLCHGQSNHVGCSPFDRHITLGLKELQHWLITHPNEIVLLYIERHLDGHEPQLAYLLDEYLGEYIFKPASIRNDSSNQKSCVSLPSTSLSKATILQSGKQLVIVAKKCDGSDTHYVDEDKYSQHWNDYVFAGIGDIPPSGLTFLDSKINDFTSYPDCGNSTIFYPDEKHTSLWRIFEDRTKLSKLEGPQKKIRDKDMNELLRCQINWPTMDMLSTNDSRLHAAVWSWAFAYPKQDQGQCAIYKNGEGIENVSCTKPLTGYACIEEKTNQIKAISANGNFADGESNCQIMAGREWHFAVPINGYQMNRLKESVVNALLPQVWVNYKEDENGHWIANHAD